MDYVRFNQGGVNANREDHHQSCDTVGGNLKQHILESSRCYFYTVGGQPKCLLLPRVPPLQGHGINCKSRVKVVHETTARWRKGTDCKLTAITIFCFVNVQIMK